jgi:hypothetical protein
MSLSIRLQTANHDHHPHVFCTRLWKINCTYKRVVVLGYEGYQLQWIFSTKLNPHVSDNAISTYYSTSHMTNLPHMETLWLKIINITFQFNQVFVVVVVFSFFCVPLIASGVFFSPSILCFQKFCDFSLFFKEKLQQLTLTLFTQLFCEKICHPKKFWIVETLFYYYFTNIYEPKHFFAKLFLN